MWNKANSQWPNNILFHLLAEHTQTHFGSNAAVVSYLNEQFCISNETDQSGSLEEWWKVFKLKKKKALQQIMIIWCVGDQRTWKEGNLLHLLCSRLTYSVSVISACEHGGVERTSCPPSCSCSHSLRSSLAPFCSASLYAQARFHTIPQRTAHCP